MTDKPDDEEYDWGCYHCRNDGRLTALNTCPECGAEYADEDNADD